MRYAYILLYLYLTSLFEYVNFAKYITYSSLVNQKVLLILYAYALKTVKVEHKTQVSENVP